jgi:outer membrane protein assembly factor BamB
MLVIPTNRDVNPIYGLKPGAAGAIKPESPDVAWRLPKGAPDVPCPVIYDGLVFFCTAEIAKLTCADLMTGKVHYTEQRLGEGRYRSSLVAAGGHIFALGRDNGTTTVVKAGPKFEVVAQNVLPDYFTASPAVANGRIYLRGFKNLYAIEAAGK